MELTIDVNKRYTFADYFSWNSDKRYELYNGRVLEMSPAPTEVHQDILGNIFGEIKIFLKNLLPKPKCKAYVAPFDVRLPRKSSEIADNQIYTVVQPDITVVCDPSKIDSKGCLGAPDLIVEIISPSTMKNDMNDKFNLYEEAGVPEYWIVFPNEKMLNVFRLDETGKYNIKEYYTYNDKVQVRAFKDLTINLSDIFE